MKRVRKNDSVERPAVIKPDHARDRVLARGAGAKKAWSRLTSYEREFRRGSFLCRERCTNASATEAEQRRALDRYEAAKSFDEGWQVCSASWPGSTGFPLVKGGGGVPGAFVDHQRDAKDYWRRVEKAMGANDWLILRRELHRRPGGRGDQSGLQVLDARALPRGAGCVGCGARGGETAVDLESFRAEWPPNGPKSNGRFPSSVVALFLLSVPAGSSIWLAASVYAPMPVETKP